MMRALLLFATLAGCGSNLVFVDITGIPAGIDGIWLNSTYGVDTTPDLLFKPPAAGFGDHTSVGLTIMPSADTLTITIEARKGDCALASQSAQTTVGGGRTTVNMKLAALTPTECVVHLPIGAYFRGCASFDPVKTDCGGPATVVDTQAVDVDITEVSQGAYRACPTCDQIVSDGDDTHPQTGVTWDQATAYCAWRAKRLLTETEWERAARADSDTSTLENIYPWGNTAPTCALANSSLSCAQGPVAVTADDAGQSPLGLFNMAGNAAEWVSDYYAASYGSNTDNPTGPTTGDSHVIRGGSYLDTTASRFRVSDRQFASSDGIINSDLIDAGDRLQRTGFRCGRTPNLTLPY